MNFAERLYEAFDDASISWDAAKAIGEIPKADSILTKANHAEVKVCYLRLNFFFQWLRDFLTLFFSLDPLRAKICEDCSPTYHFIS